MVNVVELTKNDLDEIMTSYNLAAMLHGFEGYKELEQFKYHAAEGLIRFGGSFAGALGNLLAVADSRNTFKILKVWRDELQEHADLYIKYLESSGEK